MSSISRQWLSLESGAWLSRACRRWSKPLRLSSPVSGSSMASSRVRSRSWRRRLISSWLWLTRACKVSTAAFISSVPSRARVTWVLKGLCSVAARASFNSTNCCPKLPAFSPVAAAESDMLRIRRCISRAISSICSVSAGVMWSRYRRSIISSSMDMPLPRHWLMSAFSFGLMPAACSYHTVNVMGLKAAVWWPMLASVSRSNSALRALDSVYRMDARRPGRREVAGWIVT